MSGNLLLTRPNSAMPTSCQELKTKYEELKTLKDEFVLEYNKVKDADNLTRAKELKAKLQRAVDELMEQLPVPIEGAIELLGEKDVIGHEDLKNTWGIELAPDKIPNIPFSFEELERAKELGQYLILRADKTQDGTPLTMKRMNDLQEEDFRKEGGGNILGKLNLHKDKDFFTKETPRFSWALVSKKVLDGSLNKDYLEQTEVIVDYLRNEVYKNQELPMEYQQAIDEFENQKDEIRILIERTRDGDWKETAEKLANLKITDLTKQTPAEVLFDIISYFLKNKEKLLEDTCTRTSRRAHGYCFLDVGGANSSGAFVSGRWYRDRAPYMGTTLSRRV